MPTFDLLFKQNYQNTITVGDLGILKLWLHVLVGPTDKADSSIDILSEPTRGTIWSEYEEGSTTAHSNPTSLSYCLNHVEPFLINLFKIIFNRGRSIEL